MRRKQDFENERRRATKARDFEFKGEPTTTVSTASISLHYMEKSSRVQRYRAYSTDVKGLASSTSMNATGEEVKGIRSDIMSFEWHDGRAKLSKLVLKKIEIVMQNRTRYGSKTKHEARTEQDTRWVQQAGHDRWESWRCSFRS